MQNAVRVLWLLSLTVASSVRAGEFRANGITIDVPGSFEGPVSAQPDARTRTHAFTAQANNALAPSTVLQVTEYDLARDIPAARSGHADISQRYLSQMLQGIERRRTGYRSSAAKQIRLAGFTGSVVSWQGKANRIGTNGKMFCIVTPTEILFFHVMGGGGVPNADMAAAIKAVENARKY